MKKQYDLVIARYNEGLNWFSSLVLDEFNIFLYNKGDDDIPFKYIKRPNIGRDAETFVYHIVNNYDNLAKYTVFLQGNCGEHCDDIFLQIELHKKEKFVHLCDKICSEGLGWYEKDTPNPDNKPITFLKDVAKEILGENCPKYFRFSPGQQYIVHRNLIRRRSKEFYQKILDRFEWDYLLPWHLERIWEAIWLVNPYE